MICNPRQPPPFAHFLIIFSFGLLSLFFPLLLVAIPGSRIEALGDYLVCVSCVSELWGAWGLGSSAATQPTRFNRGSGSCLFLFLCVTEPEKDDDPTGEEWETEHTHALMDLGNLGSEGSGNRDGMDGMREMGGG